MSDSERDIRADAFFLADHAAVESGKLYINGGFWNELHFPTFPASVTFSVVAVLRVPWSANPQPHEFSVWFEDVDGARFGGQIDGQVHVAPLPTARHGAPSIVPLSATVNGFPVEQPRDFSAVLSVDGDEISRWSVLVGTMAPPAGGPGSSPEPPTRPSGPRPFDLPNF